MTETEETTMHGPGSRIWTIDHLGTTNVWEVDEEGTPRLSLGNPPFPPPAAGQRPFVQSPATRLARWATLLVVVVGLALVGVLMHFEQAIAARMILSYGSFMVIGLAILSGVLWHRDKHR